MSELRARIEGLSPEKRRLLELRLKQRVLKHRSDETIRRTGSGPHRLSFAQERLWFIDRFEDTSAAYNLAWAWRLKGRLQVEALHKALDAVVARQDTLRTSFREIDGIPFQFVGPPRSVEMRFLSLEDDPSEESIRRVLFHEASRRFDLANDLLIRATLMRRQADDHVLLLTLHHIAADGWSKGILLRELSAFYSAFAAGQSADLPQLPISYSDFAEWRRKWAERDEFQDHLEYWKRQLAGIPEVLNLPADHPRPAVQRYRGARESLVLRDDFSERLGLLHRQENTTLFMTLLAIFQALLHRYAQQPDIPVGIPVSNRSRMETEGLIGLFVNTVVMRADLSGTPTFRDLLRRVREVAIGGYAHQDMPFEQIVDALHTPRHRSHSPIFQVMLSLLDTSSEVLELCGVTSEAIEVDTGGVQYDLALAMLKSSDQLTLTLAYNADLFTSATAARMLRHYEMLLRGVIHDPDRKISELPLLTEAEKQQLLLDWNQTRANYPQASVIELFESRAARTPEAIAVVDESREWTYAELDRKANCVARELQRRGVPPGSLVAICVERSVGLLAGLLGIWKAGGAYLPVDASHPQERIAFVLHEAQPAVVLTQRRLRHCLPHTSAPVCFLEDGLSTRHEPLEGTVTKATLDDLAYVIYTSGSTGMPKGVAIRHRSLTNVLYAMAAQLDATSRDTVLAATTISFDIAAVELFLGLVVGGRVAVIDRTAASDGLRLVKLIDKLGVTIVQGTPTTWQMLFETGWTGREGLKILCGGETLPKTVAERLMNCGQVCHAYGPTETTICSTALRLAPADETLSIGRPLANTQLYILDRERRPVPLGVPGELYIGGEGLADGYWNRPELTAESFVANPFADAPGSRLYKTGDLVRYLPDGNVQFLGRVDNQVKIRGFRIELGEIETVLLRHPGVGKCAVVVQEDGASHKRLVAYFESHVGASPTDADLRAHLKKKLPEYMLPSAFACMEALPVTPTGKIDRKALPALDKLRPAAPDSQFAAPRDAIERGIAEIWSHTLGVERVGIRDNFYDLGGNSLKAVQICFRVQGHFGVELPLRLFYEEPTIQGIASFLAAPRTSEDDRWAVWEFYRKDGSQPPLIGVHAVDSIFTQIAGHVAEQFPFLTLTSRVGFDGKLPPYYPCQSVEEMAERYLQYLRAARPQGPYFLMGFCGGGLIAYEMARRLTEAGEDVPFLGLFNATPFPGSDRARSLKQRLASLFEELAPLSLPGKVDCVRIRAARRALSLASRARSAATTMKRRLRGDVGPYPEGEKPLTPEAIIERVADFGTKMYASYSPLPYQGKICLFHKAASLSDLRDRWARLAMGGVESHPCPGEHVSMMEEPHVRQVAAALNESLRQSLEPHGNDRKAPAAVSDLRGSRLRFGHASSAD